MVRKKIDNRVRVLIENGVALGHRTMFVIVGDKSRDQVVILHHMLSKTSVRARPTVLWCYKEKLGFSTHRKKQMRLLQKKKRSGNVNLNEENPFELFIASTTIRFCYYNETHKILGNTYGMLVLQDFEALTPNLMARTIETIEGGGIVVILLQSVQSLKQLFTMTMDVHWRFRTEAHQNVVGRFNERFILSLGSCRKALVVDDQLNVLPISSHAANINPVASSGQEEKVSPQEQELRELKESLQDTQPVGALVSCCKTKDQAKALLKFVEAISEKTLRATVTLTAARGRGKSAALGLAISAAVGFGYSNIFVTSPSPENLKTLFEFVLKGFDALHYQEHLDYELIQSTNPEFNKAVVRLNVFREHRQTIQYIHPGDANKLGQAELLVIDEAAAIPLPLVKALLGPYLIFMASTINGYEGTGRSLSLKLIQQLRQQSATMSGPAATGRTLSEVSLEESIRYLPGDDIEDWLNKLLCLNATISPLLSSGCPQPLDCQLYYVNRDTLFSFHAASENFLQQLMALYVASHYKNSPNDLQMLSDAPAHHLFCLLPPTDPNTRSLPEVLCVLQVCLEGEISKGSVTEAFSRGKRASGDLIPWTVSQQFQDVEFPSLSGARVVRIATHPDYQKMGYGSRALQLLQDYFEGRLSDLDENDEKNMEDASGLREVDESQVSDLLNEKLSPRSTLPPLLLRLNERTPEKLDYLGVSYGLTGELMKFWKRASYVPVYLRQTPNDLTGEHSCIMLKTLHSGESGRGQWLLDFWLDFRRRFVSLLSFQFRQFKPSLALSILQNKIGILKKELSRDELSLHMTLYDLKRLEMYSQNLVDHHLIMDLLPTIAKLYFVDHLGDTHLSAVQAAILLGLGLQHRTVETVSEDLDLPSSQVLGLYNRSIRRITQYLKSVMEKALEGTLPISKSFENMKPLEQSIDQDLEEEGEKKKVKKLHQLNAGLQSYAIKGSEDDWSSALQGGNRTLVSIKSIHESVESTEAKDFEEENFSGKPQKKKRKWKRN